MWDELWRAFGWDEAGASRVSGGGDVGGAQPRRRARDAAARRREAADARRCSPAAACASSGTLIWARRLWRACCGGIGSPRRKCGSCRCWSPSICGRYSSRNPARRRRAGRCIDFHRDLGDAARAVLLLALADAAGGAVRR